jgi:hypothetical protein
MSQIKDLKFFEGHGKEGVARFTNAAIKIYCKTPLKKHISKPIERRGRKATGLMFKNDDRRVAIKRSGSIAS